MQRKASRVFVYFCLSCLALCLALVAQARNDHNFGGIYKIIKATPQGDNVEVRMSLRVINNSGADVKDATISLKSSLVNRPPGHELEWEKAQAPIKAAVLHFNEHKIVPPIEATFIMPSPEYQQLLKNGGPNFVIDYTDASETQRHDRVDLAPAP
jgi:hypothetical protein